VKLLLENWRRFLNEEVVGNLVFGYTEMSPKDFENFKNQGFKLRAHRGPLGRGLYARYKYRGGGPASAEDPSYGSVIVKFKISLEDKIPILQYEDSKIAYPYYRLVDQLIKFGILSSNDVAAADKQLNQLHPEALNQMIEWLHESSFVDPQAAQDQKDPTGPGAELIQDDKFKIVLLSRLVDALNSDIPKNAPYVSHMIKNLKGADEILSTDTVGQQLLKIRSFGTNVAGIMTYVGEGSTDGYVLFLNTPKLAIPISYYSFDEEGFKELGLQQGSANLDALRDVQRNEKRYRIMTKEGGDWVWNLGLGKEAVFGWLDIAGLVIDGKSTLEKLSGARIWDDKWPKMFGGGKRGGYISGPRGVPPAQRLGDMDRTWPILKQIIASGTKVIPKPVFKKFSKEAMRSWLKSASKRRKEMSPEQRAKEQSLPDIGWADDLPTSAEIQARGLRPDPFYVSETKFIFENWRKYLIEGAEVPLNVAIGTQLYSDAYLDRFTLRQIKTLGFDHLFEFTHKLLSGNPEDEHIYPGPTKSDIKGAVDKVLDYLPRLISAVENKMREGGIQDRSGRWEAFKKEAKWILDDFENLKAGGYTDKVRAEKIKNIMDSELRPALNGAFVAIAPPEIK